MALWGIAIVGIGAGSVVNLVTALKERKNFVEIEKIYKQSLQKYLGYVSFRGILTPTY